MITKLMKNDKFNFGNVVIDKNDYTHVIIDELAEDLYQSVRFKNGSLEICELYTIDTNTNARPVSLRYDTIIGESSIGNYETFIIEDFNGAKGVYLKFINIENSFLKFILSENEKDEHANFLALIPEDQIKRAKSISVTFTLRNDL